MWMVVIGNLQGHEKRQMLPWVVVACQASPETFHSFKPLDMYRQIETAAALGGDGGSSQRS
jgi:hypothetical protein